MIVKTIQDEIQNFLVDASNYMGNCEAVYFPNSADEVKEIIKEANKSKTAVTIAGNGTGLTGGRVPLEGVVVSTEKLNKIREVNTENNFAKVQAGVVLKDFQNCINEKKYFYPPDPTETNCFIGGVIATNASGAKTFMYGATRNFVEALDIVLPDGNTLGLKRGSVFAKGNTISFNSHEGQSYKIEIPNYKLPEVKNAAGYFLKNGMDAIDLFVGSEGTLGIITEAKIKILPMPEKILSCVVFFESEFDGLNFISEARYISKSIINEDNINRLNARALEFWDEKALRFLQEDYQQIKSSFKCAVWFEQEINSVNEDFLMNEWVALIEKHNGNENNVWVGFSNSEIDEIKNFRHAISYKVNEFITRNNFRKLGTDVAVPDKHFEKFYFNCKSIVVDANINFVAYGHFGNSHLHLNMLPEDEKQFILGKEIYKHICREAINLGGTISAEHGIGKMKTDYLVMMYGEKNVREMAKIKKYLDPNLILNIGNMFVKEYLL